MSDQTQLRELDGDASEELSPVGSVPAEHADLVAVDSVHLEPTVRPSYLGSLAVSPIRAGEPPVLEPASAPAFSYALRGYRRSQVDEYCSNQRHWLAIMRTRAREAERELRRVRQAVLAAGLGELLAEAEERRPAAGG